MPALKHLDLNSLITVDGYWVIVISCLLESETVLILFGIAAHLGTLQLLNGVGGPSLAECSVISFYSGPTIILVRARWPNLSVTGLRSKEARGLFIAPVLVVRFLHRIRVVGTMVIGAGSQASYRFGIIKMLSALIWLTL